MSKEVEVSQSFPRLTVYSDENFRGRRRILRGNLGIRNTDLILDGIESLKFFSPRAGATLVVFSRTRFRGAFRVFRGNTNLRILDNLIRGGDVESIISSDRFLSEREIRRIRATGILPIGFRRI
ncbi:hypothetical protein ACFQZE_03395 [Paenibacillus sp. GCM10027627]|uniref:hypothetical protein n=1 Tax=unclassified Paenibacillus TaxID=185978 RepID=UPI003631DA76